jgi:hypothetical protein
MCFHAAYLLKAGVDVMQITFYRFETWSPTVKEGHELQVSQRKVLKKYLDRRKVK